LVLAAAHGDIAGVKTALAAKVGADAKVAGETALTFAAGNGHVEIVQLLIAAGADVNAHEDAFGWTPLITAASKHPDVVDALIAAGADVNAKGKLGETALTRAAMGGQSDSVSSLLSAGAEADGKGYMGMTALNWAASNNHPETVQLLLSHGADANSPGNGEMPLKEAEYKKYDQVAELLRAHGGHE